MVKLSKAFLVIGLMIGFSENWVAAATPAETSSLFKFSPTVFRSTAGSVAVSLSSIGQGDNDPRGKYLAFQPSFEYFVFDNFSAGLGIEYYRVTDSDYFDGIYYSGGPIATYHFLQLGRVTSYTTAQYFVSNFTKTNGSESSIRTSFGIGLNYNISQSFSIGPRFTWRHSTASYKGGPSTDFQPLTMTAFF